MKQTYAIFGLGRYGTAVARELVRSGAEVLAVDSDEEIVNSLVGELPYCKCADVTDPDVLRQLGVSNIDVVVIAMANHLEASVMAAMLCKELGVKTVIAKCSSDMNCRILSRVGADRVVFPESESGIRLAKNLLSSGFMDIIELSTELSMVAMDVRPEWVGRSLAELNLRKRYSINVVAVIRGNATGTLADPDMKLDASMKLIVVAEVAKLHKLQRMK